MKNILLLLAVSLFCKEPDRFRGFGELKIGADFATLKRAKDFKAAPDDHYIREFEIGDGIGWVANLDVKTENKKIVSVRFKTTDKTDIEKLQNSLGDLVEIKPDPHYKDLPMPVGNRIYLTPDGKIWFSIREILPRDEKKYEVTYDDNERYTRIVKEGHDRPHSR